jgi:hypothetical protein
MHCFQNKRSIKTSSERENIGEFSTCFSIKKCIKDQGSTEDQRKASGREALLYVYFVYANKNTPTVR